MFRTWNVSAALPVHYQVRLVDGLLDVDNLALLQAGAPGPVPEVRRLIVIDGRVDQLYGARLRRYLDSHGVRYSVLALDVSEAEKTMASVFRVVNAIDEFGVSRRHEPVLAIGGGVLLDIVGLAASLYRRSTPWVRVPTTLIGLVDAGVGAKTGINHGTHKNRLGSYFPALVTLLDRAFLRTLDERHLGNGLAEILKIALIKDRPLFDVLESSAELLLAERLQGKTAAGEDAANLVIDRAITGMLEELECNLWEHKLERLVDFGHSFSPSIELLALPDLLHGEAVNVDMALSTLLARQRGTVTTHEQERIFALMRRLNLPLYHPLCESKLLEKALAETVRHRDGRQRLPLGVGIGSGCFVNDLDHSELAMAAAALAEFAHVGDGGGLGDGARDGRRVAHG